MVKNESNVSDFFLGGEGMIYTNRNNKKRYSVKRTVVIIFIILIFLNLDNYTLFLCNKMLNI